jgi:chromosome segregation ATPase
MNRRSGRKLGKENKSPQEPVKDKFREKMLDNLETHLTNVYKTENQRLIKENEGLNKEKSEAVQKLMCMEVEAKSLTEHNESLRNQVHRQSELKDFFALEVEVLRKECAGYKDKIQELKEENLDLSRIIESLSNKFQLIERTASRNEITKGGNVTYDRLISRFPI